MYTIPYIEASLQHVFSAGGVHEVPDPVYQQYVFSELVSRLEQRGLVDLVHHLGLGQALELREL